MKKTFILDTNVLLYDPQSVLKFDDNKVVIPLIVIEELDRFKKDQHENGRNARYFSRIVDDLRKKGSLAKGVKLDNGGTLQVYLDKAPPKDKVRVIDFSINDNLILGTALHMEKAGEKVILVSKDINLRVKADALGIPADDYDTREINIDEMYTGYRIYEVPLLKLQEFERNRFLPIEAGNVRPNEYLIVCEEGNERHRSLGRYCHEKKGVVPLIRIREGVWGIHPKNVEQQFALDALLNDDIKLVTLVGKAGTGKTLMAIAAGLECTIAQDKYARMLVSRPIQPMGKDIGYLPGDVSDKLGPWMQPIFDNMDFLFTHQRGSDLTSSWEDLINQGLLHVEPLTYIRGRSIPAQYLIIDESQNLSPHEVKTIVTRAGEGTKIVLTGDTQQIDSPYLDSINNGLNYCVEKLKGEDIVAHTTLRVGERSALSEVATKLF